MPATIQVVASIQANESFDNFAGIGLDGQSIMETVNPITRVIYPPDISGSAKLVLKGLPAGCASEDLKLKARAKGDIGRFTATLAGPRDEWGARYADSFGKTIARATGKSRLKAKIPVSKLTPGLLHDHLPGGQQGPPDAGQEGQSPGLLRGRAHWTPTLRPSGTFRDGASRARTGDLPDCEAGRHRSHAKSSLRLYQAESHPCRLESSRGGCLWMRADVDGFGHWNGASVRCSRGLK